MTEYASDDEGAENRKAAIEALISASKTVLEPGTYAGEKKVPSLKVLNSLRIRVGAFLREMPSTMTTEEIIESLELNIEKTDVADL